MEKLTLKAKIRNIFGKKNKSLRQKGLVPAVVYGRKTSSLPLEVEAKSFKDIYSKAGDTGLIDLIIQGEKEEVKKVLVQDIDRHYLNNEPVHIDFYEVEMDKPVTIYVPLVFEGESPAIKMGGILVKSMDKIEIEALPKDLPHFLIVDISSIDELDKTIYVKDIKLPTGVKALVKENTPVVTISTPISEEELEKELGKVETIEQVKIEGEKKEEGKIEEEKMEN